MIAKVGEPQVYGEKLVKPALIACAEELLGKDAAATLSTIPLSNNTVTRRQDEMASNIEEQLVHILKKTKFSVQVDETSIHNQSLMLTFTFVLFIRKLFKKRCYSLLAS